ncbi:MAG: hypothetical protein WCX80_01025, partial [Patescibacteria group bacterium]
TYTQTESGASYSIAFCIGNTTGAITPGNKTLTPGGIIAIETVEEEECDPACTGEEVCTNGVCETPAAVECLVTPESCSWQAVGSPILNGGSLYAYNGVPYVAYTNIANGYLVNLVKYENSAWEEVSNPVSTGVGYGSSLFMAGSVPYIAYIDSDQSDKASVRTYAGSWANIGSAGFTSDSVTELSTFVAGGVTYVAYVASTTQKVGVMKYLNPAWTDVGLPEFSNAVDTENNRLNFVIAAGSPYVSYVEPTNVVTVMKFNGSTWGSVKSVSGFDHSLFARNGILYLSYFSQAEMGIIVEKYENSAWTQVGSTVFNTGSGIPLKTCLFVSSDNTVYLGYKDQTVVPYEYYGTDKISIVRYVNSSWSLLGSANFSNVMNNSRYYINVSNDIPYVGYSDDTEFEVMNFIATP